MSNYSQKQLRKEPDSALNFIRYQLKQSTIIDGLRNPRDFCALFDYRKDTVVLLKYMNNKIESLFDEGVDVIESYVKWLVKNKLLPQKQFRTYKYRSYSSLDKIFQNEKEVYDANTSRN